ncbi:radical SAM protein [Lacrimispora sphenoides]|uniref:4Fe-4S single cluster domain-containing protein n=1 Tax=Lacrimispora sphenoides JCM 1415 TaxID=1297793 RepID=A0ABY1CCV0_9FIRM|nr:radical SAM protein [Lacrimispora sphenoides]SET93898.1 4Fe-4S single cluster domain-containing protein [[Clostridium] sphenoides JCM 1415]SUY52533.1 radical SAM protein [Lacrimispora sphenoides]
MKKLNNAKEIRHFYDGSMEYDEINEELNLLKVCLITTHRCTLKCKLCAERTAYFEKRYHPTLDEIYKSLDQYFRLVTFTEKVDVSGGEPLTRNDLSDIMRRLLRYKDQFGRVRILTNGTLVPSDELCAVLKQFKDQADVLIDDYGSISPNATAAKQKLKEYGIDFILRPQNEKELHFGGWIDYGDLSLKNTPEEAEKLFKKCAINAKIGLAIRIRDGKLTPCMVTDQLNGLKGVQTPSEEVVDLFDEELSDKEKRKKIIHFFQMSYFDACRYCNGLCSDSKRYLPAEQLHIDS